jgi:hypothetical protein
MGDTKMHKIFMPENLNARDHFSVRIRLKLILKIQSVKVSTRFV